MEVMRIALEEKTWVEATPPFGSIEEIQQMFQSPPPLGKKVECSVQCADIPYDPKLLLSTMMDAFHRNNHDFTRLVDGVHHCSTLSIVWLPMPPLVICSNYAVHLTKICTWCMYIFNYLHHL